MTRYFTMHCDNPQPRLIKQAAEAIQSGELVAYLTDSGYAFGCALTSRDALEKLRRLRGLDERHPLTLLCHSISEAAQYCQISNEVFAILKRYTPGPYTFILPATKKVPRLVQGIKRKVVGIRIPQHPIALALAQAIGSPILSSTLWLKGESDPIHYPGEIAQKTKGEVDLIIDGGSYQGMPSTVVDLVENTHKVIRKGIGDPAPFEGAD